MPNFSSPKTFQKKAQRCRKNGLIWMDPVEGKFSDRNPNFG